MNAIVTIILFLVLFLGGAILQGFLANVQNKYLGLILPSIFFLSSLLYAFSVFVFSAVGIGVGGIILTTLYVFLLGNIPTVILLLIYFMVRKGKSSKKTGNTEFDKMNIMDL